MFDQFDTVSGSDAGAFLHLVSPANSAPAFVSGEDGKADKERPIGIDLLGPDADVLRQRARKRASKLIKQRAGQTDFKKMSLDAIEAFVVEGEESSLSDAVDATIGWANMTLDGAGIEYSPENAVLVYTRYPEILRQVVAFQKETANFLQKA